MRKSPKQNLRNREKAIGGRRRGTASGPPNSRLKPRVSPRIQRPDGALLVNLGLTTIALDDLCPSKMAIALHRQLIGLMASHPAQFPAMSMCHRTHRHDNRLALNYGSERHMISMDTAREYLSRLIGGYTDRHTKMESQ